MRLAEFHRLQQEARTRRPQRDLDRLARQGKLFVRDRLELLLDPGTPFLEFSTLAANMAYDGEVPGAGQVTGIGIVSGREVVIRADDASVKGGAWYPLSVKKIVRALDIAIENRLPVIHICDSAGGFLPLQAELFADRYYAGRIFRNQCTLSKMGVPQVAIVVGHCTAGGAYIPGLSEYSVIVRGTGAIFLGGPPLVKAATGEIVTADELGGADLHTQVSGTADYPAATEPEAIAIGARHRRPVAPPEEEPRSSARSPSRPTTTPRSSTGSFRETSKFSSTCARSSRASSTAAASTSTSPPTAPRWSAASRTSGATRSASSPTTACCSTTARSRARTSWSSATATARRWCSCRTSPATWSAASTRHAASPRTAPR